MVHIYFGSAYDLQASHLRRRKRRRRRRQQQQQQQQQQQLNLITVQQDATYSVYYISVGSSACFGCRHPSSGARTIVITASGID